jgi:hypothetical protein
LVISLDAWEQDQESGTTTDLWFNTEAHIFDPASGDNLSSMPLGPRTRPPDVEKGPEHSVTCSLRSWDP